MFMISDNFLENYQACPIFTSPTLEIKRKGKFVQMVALLRPSASSFAAQKELELCRPFLQSVTLHTDVGDIKIELFCEQCPKACENFLALCASDYYNGCLFHRNIKGFMVQTGDPTGTGKGGTSIWGGKFEDELKDDLKHNTRGIVSLASNGPNTNGSQFFITYSKQPHLDMKYTVFGKVIDGLETLDELEKLPVNPKSYRPLSETRLNSVTIHANPFAK